jgi:hypothetical protein
MQYAYWAVVCKECGLKLLLNGGYVGTCSPSDTLIDAERLPSGSVDLPCSGCNTTQRYREEDYLIIRLDHKVESDAAPDV